MGSQLSGILACLYFKFFKSQPFKHILPNVIQYFRQIDDVLIIYPKEYNISSVVHNLKQVEPNINFTYELGKNNYLPFQDILLIKLEFKVYPKVKNKNDLIHFYSNHSCITKSGILKCLFLRGARICFPEFLTKILNTSKIIFPNYNIPNPSFTVLNQSHKSQGTYILQYEQK